MSAHPEPGPEAVEFMTRLRERGVTFGLRGNRLWLTPGRAYKDLSPEEFATLRRCRADIKQAIRSEASVSAPPLAETPLAEPPAPAPPPPEPEPERLMWTWDFQRRITLADVEVAYGGRPPAGISRSEAFAYARTWLEQEQLRRYDSQVVALILRHGIEER